MEIKKIDQVVRVVEPEKFVITLSREELKAITDDINAGNGVDWRSTEGRISTDIWKKFRDVLCGRV